MRRHLLSPRPCLFLLPSAHLLYNLQQQWARTFSKTLAHQHIGEWRAFRDFSLASAPSPSPMSPSRKSRSGLAGTTTTLGSIVGDAKTFAAAAKAVRFAIDPDFHLLNVSVCLTLSNAGTRAEDRSGMGTARCYLRRTQHSSTG